MRSDDLLAPYRGAFCERLVGLELPRRRVLGSALVAAKRSPPGAAARAPYPVQSRSVDGLPVGARDGTIPSGLR